MPQILKVVLPDLPPEHKTIWFGYAENLPTKFFAVTAPKQETFNIEGHRYFELAVLWLVDPMSPENSTKSIRCRRCVKYADGRGDVEAGPYFIAIPKATNSLVQIFNVTE